MVSAFALTDVLVVGGGPSGLALASELARRGLGVRVVAPHAPQPFAPTYGAWLDELPAWAQACTAQVWTDVRAYTGSQPTPLLRPYALLDNTRLLDTLLERAGERLCWTQGKVTGAQQRGNLWQVHGEAGEEWTARLVVDASGHGGLLLPTPFEGGPALQTAYGVVAHFQRPPSPPGAMVWMDYRTPHLDPADVRAEPTFLYSMHLGGDRYFVQETSLIARPAPSREFMKARLYARLDALGTPPHDTESDEWVAFPMNAPAPIPGPVLAYGAAAGLVHPISGFQVAGALADAPRVAEAIAAALENGQDAAAAGWDALWPPERRAARGVHLLDLGALLELPGDRLGQFFAAFFRLPAAEWHAFLAPHTGVREMARSMLKVFAHAPNAVRLPLVRAALAHPGVSLSALKAAARMKAASASSHPALAAARHPEGMTKSDDASSVTGQREANSGDIDQQEVIEEGMQGAVGNVNAAGLAPGVDREEKLEELRENMAEVTGQK
ncbi:lycopene cyclase family protein [Deinococcus arenicola]|uniref:Lycopene cyclase family protein n=1 Tax=Deinococcus arenicola TaxID=2994950 RepID=A0ABU4DTP9_9DEIO|nr:lycopene cyclase family protein [Deinococcus sp. ZS9-10]MDV6375816.1 lycopene cyclase family protein [Deinococcus sp. ZS9-10]